MAFERSRSFRPAGLGLALWLAACLGLAAPAAAQTATPEAPAEAVGETERQDVAPLLAALGLPELLPIMQAEGLAYTDDLAAEMFPGRGGAGWDRMANRVYRLDRMTEVMEREMARALTPGEIDTLMPFFTSERGQRIVGLELSAREALLDDAVEAGSREALAVLRADGDPRLEILRDFIETNDLVEMNVVGALNSNYAFYQGLAAGGAFEAQLSDDQMLAEVWSQEAEIRDETEEWVYSYLAMAYGPLADADVEAYTELSRTAEGRALNAALFSAFDVLFTDISRDLGLAAATFMAGEDL